MAKGLFVTGTDTGVGKTVITGGLAGVFRKNGIAAAAFKPVQAGGIESEQGLLSEDALFYRAAAGLPYSVRDMNPCCLRMPLSPNIAARVSGQVIDPAALAEAYQRLAGENDYVLVEGAGGLCVPLVDYSFTMADLAHLLGIPLLVVARPGLGTINHTVLTVRHAQWMGLEVKGIVINGYRKEQATLAERTNPEVIEGMTGVPILGIVPYLPETNVELCRAGGLVEIIEEKVEWRSLM
ncbi:dethiobiotin synthase [Pelotomaculum terephthalicicum JT]|uniref:dethiobiotin synthase n=1 Tax=Pelotomaculum TaxID=191373 RepID=UPI0009C735F3|nr:MULTISPECIES: dethiobiotin synthase [Pelotomaculum]MCG9968635.1 dethiobiotin synthase [Pelotomaculum terephthalicicum JT]OPX85259.1 MAG: ATP-dependent dethiobiotin synthetase BioD 1 [Pelotomaculum sp. PtaB.Bin117]OPY62588.1 MAG: ATP-dependent dethiobiotin synthetase BioD 1 [Pelotomaculum sp. PtaU1.Bin065]